MLFLETAHHLSFCPSVQPGSSSLLQSRWSIGFSKCLSQVHMLKGFYQKWNNSRNMDMNRGWESSLKFLKILGLWLLRGLQNLGWIKYWWWWEQTYLSLVVTWLPILCLIQHCLFIWAMYFLSLREIASLFFVYYKWSSNIHLLLSPPAFWKHF